MPIGTMVLLVDGSVPVAADFNNNFSVLNTTTIPVGSGGTGLTAGTSGGVLYYSAAATLASSALLTANGVLLGGGAGAAPTATAAGSAYNPLRVPSGGGAPAFGALDISQSAAVTGTLAVGNGGTGLTAGTSGGILGYTGTGTLASSILLTANALLLGGGAGATPTPLSSLGTTTTVLHGNAAGAPTFAAISLSADVSGNLPVANLNSGTGATSSTFWRGDATWVAPSATYSQSADVATEQTTTSTTYTDLATVGPAITMSPGLTTNQIISVSAKMWCGPAAAPGLFSSVAIAGAGALDVDAANIDSAASAAPPIVSSMRMVRAPSVADGATHTMKYRVGSSTGTFVNRRIIGMVA